MKQLLEYLNNLPPEEREPFSERCGTSFDYLRQIGYGNRKCSAELAIEIDRETNSEIKCEDLCQKADWEWVESKKHKPELADHPSPQEQA